MNVKGFVDESNLSPDEIEAMLDEGVSRAVEYVYERSPFYREKLDSAGLDPGDIRSVRDLERIPPTTKADFAAGGETLHCVGRDMIADIVTTSGTTGRPVIYPLTCGDIDRLGVNEQLSFSCAGLSASDTVLVAVTLDKCFMAGLAYYEGLKKLGAAAVRVGAGSPAMLIDMVERLSATAIVSVPSFLERIARYASDHGIDLSESSVERLVCIGEPVRTEDFTLNVLGGGISRAWGANVYSTYGATEIAGSLCECEAGAGGHLHPSLLFVEILDEQGRRVPDGEPGEVVATTIGVEAMPLIRFRMGDMSFMATTRCECGRCTPRIGPILARKNEMLKLKGTTVFPATIYNVLNAIPNVLDYVLVATAAASLSDELEVVVSLSDGDEGVCEEISERLKGALKVTPGVRVATDSEIATVRGDAGSRKKRLFVDLRTATP